MKRIVGVGVYVLSQNPRAALPPTTSPSATAFDPAADVVLVYVHHDAQLDAHAEAALGAALGAARRDRLAWIAYPKDGQLGTDLNRDSLWAALEGRDVRPVRQVAIGDVWSALRFRPA